jgi:hypothetical protein
LVDIIISNNLIVVLLFPDELAIKNFIALIAHEPVQRRNNGLQVNTFRDGLDSILALGAAIIVVRAFEDEAQALWHEAYVARFAPAEQVQRDLPKPVILAHVVHSIAPSLLRAVEGLRSFGASFDTLKALKARVIRLPDSVVKVELGGKVPFAVISMLAADVISVKGQKGLVGGHAGSSRVEKLHCEVKLGCGYQRSSIDVHEMSHTMLRIESLWNPNFCVRSRNMSSISSVDMGI